MFFVHLTLIYLVHVTVYLDIFPSYLHHTQHIHMCACLNILNLSTDTNITLNCILVMDLTIFLFKSLHTWCLLIPYNRTKFSQNCVINLKDNVQEQNENVTNEIGSTYLLVHELPDSVRFPRDFLIYT